MPGANVLNVVRRHRVCSSLVYPWRRTVLCAGVAVEAKLLPAPAFVPIDVASVPSSAQREPLRHAMVEVVGPGGQRVRLAPSIDARVLKAVLAVFG